MNAYTTALLAGLIAASPVLAQPAAMPGMARGTVAGMKTGKAEGMVTAIDRKTSKITIKHGPIPSIGWPAMTMAFTATKPAMLDRVKVGQAIGFDVRTKGMAAEVTAIRPR